MCVNTVRQDAIVRCRDAYLSNGISWDPALESLPIPTLLETADYWEKKSQHKPEKPIYDLLSSTAQLRDQLSRLAGFPKHICSSGGRTPRQQSKNHHGTRRPQNRRLTPRLPRGFQEKGPNGGDRGFRLND